jgi:hypothetical protein
VTWCPASLEPCNAVAAAWPVDMVASLAVCTEGNWLH